MKTSKSEAMYAKVEEWKHSGKTLRTFASSIGISKSAFEYWVRKARKISAGSPGFMELMPLVQSKKKVEPTSKHPVSDVRVQIEITLSGGMSVKIYG